MDQTLGLAVASTGNRESHSPADLDAVARAAAGDPGGFGWLLSAYRGRILRLTTAVLHDPDLAEDAAQECFIKEFRAIRSFRGESSFYTWLSRIAMRACMDCLRRRRPGTEPETRGSGDCVSAGPAHASVERLAVEALLDRLTPALRAALVLRELDGLEYDEIAETLGIPVGTVRSRLHAARARFRELYAEASEEADSV